MTAHTRPLRPADSPQVLALNNASVPAVSELDEVALTGLLGQSHLAIAVVDDVAPDTVLGFALTLLPGQEYGSENYRWFSDRSNDFLYVDRIALGEGSRGRGFGRLLYADMFRAAREAGASELFCEVNLEPPNPGSMRFHERLGFVRIGEQSTKGGAVVVAMLAAPVG